MKSRATAATGALSVEPTPSRPAGAWPPRKSLTACSPILQTGRPRAPSGDDRPKVVGRLAAPGSQPDWRRHPGSPQQQGGLHSPLAAPARMAASHCRRSPAQPLAGWKGGAANASRDGQGRGCRKEYGGPSSHPFLSWVTVVSWIKARPGDPQKAGFIPTFPAMS